LKPLSFQPNESESEFIYENIDSWSGYCHKNLKRDMSFTRFNKFNRVALYLLLVCIGLIISFIGMVVVGPVSVIFGMYLIGGVLVVFGVVSIIGVYRYG
jgi:Flp pilus assembly protein TadB